MRTMHQVALEWVAQGKTTLVEVERVLGMTVDDDQQQAEIGPPRILLVDDDQEARLMMRTLLEKEDFVIEEAADGHEAADRLDADATYSLLILDLGMPGMDGRELLQKIRGSVETMALPVLIRTGSGSNKLEAELLEAGADDYLTKEMDADRFLARVRAVLRRALI